MERNKLFIVYYENSELDKDFEWFWESSAKSAIESWKRENVDHGYNIESAEAYEVTEARHEDELKIEHGLLKEIYDYLCSSPMPTEIEENYITRIEQILNGPNTTICPNKPTKK